MNTRYSTKPRQSFEIGNVVKIGFVEGLEVIKKIATPREPHDGGLVRCADLAEAMAAF